MPPQFTRHWLHNVDPRLKILTAACFGIATWHVPPIVLGGYAFVLWLLCAQAEFFSRANWPMLRSYLWFVLFWAVIKFALDCTPLLTAPYTWNEPLVRQAALEAGLLAARLCVLIGLGLMLALTTSPRRLGLALCWYLRPVLGRNSWKTALSLSLMIHFLPLVQSTISQVKSAILQRNLKRSRWQRFMLVPQATLRILAQKTWTQTVAVASRGLDTPDAWIPRFQPQPLVWMGGFLLIAAGLIPVLLP